MKKVLALVLGLVLLASCSATRKATKAKESQLDSTAVVKEVTEQTEKVVDTTRTESQPNHNRHPSQRQVLIWTISVRCKAWSSP